MTETTDTSAFLLLVREDGFDPIEERPRDRRPRKGIWCCVATGFLLPESLDARRD